MNIGHRPDHSPEQLVIKKIQNDDVRSISRCYRINSSWTYQSQLAFLISLSSSRCQNIKFIYNTQSTFFIKTHLLSWGFGSSQWQRHCQWVSWVEPKLLVSVYNQVYNSFVKKSIQWFVGDWSKGPGKFLFG